VDLVIIKRNINNERIITFENIKKKMPTLTDFHIVMKEKIKNEELNAKSLLINIW